MGNIDAPLKEIELKATTGEGINARNEVNVQAIRRQTINYRQKDGISNFPSSENTRTA
jgi:hypothetical protein